MNSNLNPWLNRWRREVVLVGCLAVAFAILLVFELGHRELTDRYESAAESMAATARLHRLAARVADAESAQRSFLLLGSRDFLQPYQSAVPEIRRLLERSRAHYAVRGDAEADKLFGALTTAIATKLGEIGLTLELVQHGHGDRAMEIVDSGIGERTSQEIRFLLEDLSLREDAFAAQVALGWRSSLALSRLGITLVAALNIALIGALFFGLKRDWRAARARHTSLDRLVRERTQQLESLASRLQEAAEAERAALARELHDELGSLLTASRMDIAWVKQRLCNDPAGLGNRLDRVLHHLEQGIVAKQQIVEGLRPSALSNFGLATAARQLSEQVAERAGWKLDLDLPETDPRLPDDIETALFRVLQESLTNAAKYSAARSVRVRLDCSPTRCRLQVEDDGRGFRVEAIPTRSHGLIGMRQRIEAKAGELNVRSRPGHGTLITASLPPVERSHPASAVHATDSRPPGAVGVAGA